MRFGPIALLLILVSASFAFGLAWTSAEHERGRNLFSIFDSGVRSEGTDSNGEQVYLQLDGHWVSNSVVDEIVQAAQASISSEQLQELIRSELRRALTGSNLELGDVELVILADYPEGLARSHGTTSNSMRGGIVESDILEPTADYQIHFEIGSAINNHSVPTNSEHPVIFVGPEIRSSAESHSAANNPERSIISVDVGVLWSTALGMTEFEGARLLVAAVNEELVAHVLSAAKDAGLDASTDYPQ